MLFNTVSNQIDEKHVCPDQIYYFSKSLNVNLFLKKSLNTGDQAYSGK